MCSASTTSPNDNLSYGDIISVYTGPDEAITSLTRDGMEELEQMLALAGRTADEWNDFLEAFIPEPHTIARIKAKSPR